MPASDASGLMLQVRQYGAAPRSKDLRDEFQASLRKIGVAGNKATILAHECAHASRATVWPATVKAVISEHNLRSALGDIRLPVLGAKTTACRDLLLRSS